MPVQAQAEFPATRMVRLVNELRAARGLNVLQVDPVLQQTSDRWSATMAVNREIFHNDNLRAHLDDNWSKVGENVGRGPSIDEIQVGFATSADHLKNLLDPRWDAMAIGVVNGPTACFTSPSTSKIFGKCGGIRLRQHALTRRVRPTRR